MITLPPPEIDLPAEHLLRQLLDALAAHPEVREPLLRVLLTEDFLALPERVNHLQKTLDDFREETRSEFRRVDARIDENSSRIDENTAQIRVNSSRIDENTRQIQENTRQISENTAQIRENTEQIRENTRELRRLSGPVGRLIGNSYEDLCRRRIEVILDGPLERPVLADRDAVDAQLRGMRQRGLITRAEFDDGLRADIVACAAADAAQPGRLFVGEASISFNRRDLETAARRAALIGRATGVPTVAFLVTQNDWPPEADAVALQLGVTIIQYEPDRPTDESEGWSVAATD